MFIIVHTDNCTEIAQKIAKEFEDSSLVPVMSALSDPESLGDFDNLGLVFEREGKDLPSSMQAFIKTVLSDYDLSGLQYMFSACVCEGSPAHALKIVEKLNLEQPDETVRGKVALNLENVFAVDIIVVV